jgi:hypothetical protein
MNINVNVNSIVRIGQIAPTLMIRSGFIAGQVGFVEELSADGRRALIQGLAMPGRPIGRTAWVPVTCLTVEADTMWAGALVEYQRWFAEVVRENEERKRRWRRELQEVAEKHKLTVQEVREIVSALEFNGAIYE